MSDSIVLKSEGAEAQVSALGAELTRWRVDGRDLLWSADPRWWERTAPVLFPIVGWARDGRIMVDGRRRPMGVHGFAAARPFAVKAAGEDHARLTLRDDEASRDVYPFAFRLTLDYRLKGVCLAMTGEVENRGDRPMPYAFGFHPGFVWPLSGERDGHAVLFDREERPDVPVIAPGGLFGEERWPVPLAGRRLPLSDALFAREALCFLNAASRTLRYEAPDGSGLRFDLFDCPHLALWSKPGALFLSVEAWTGHGDPVGFDGELKDKPSMRLLAPGEVARHGMTVTFEA